MLRRLWMSRPWGKKNQEDRCEEEELEEIEIGVPRERSSTDYTLTDAIDGDTDIPPAFAAVQQSDIVALESHLDDLNFDIDLKCGGLTLLHFACHLKKLDVLRTILNHGALINLLDDEGNTSLHTAVAEGWHDGVRELLQHGASTDIKSKPQETAVGDMTSETPLHIAVRRGDIPSTYFLLEKKPDLYSCDSNQCTVLHLAARSLDVQMLNLLLKEKVCQELLDYEDKDGNSVMHAAVPKRRKNYDESAILKVLRLLFEQGVNVNSLNIANESPLFLAASVGLQETVSFLLSLGADVRVLTNKNQSLLHGACQGGNAKCLQYLIDTKSLFDYVTQADSEGNEPFYYAIHSSSIDCCDLLLKNGEYLTRKDKNGVSRCSLLLTYLPSAPKLLESMFDKCISFSDKSQHDPDFRIKFDYSILLAPTEDSRTPFQSSIISILNSYSASETLLKHPLIESFLFCKWNKIKIFFYTNVLTFFIFLLLHSFYIVSLYKRNPMAFSLQVANVWIFRFLHTLMYLLLVIPEVIVTLSHPKKILKHWETWTKFISLIASAFVVFTPITMRQLTGQDSNASDTRDLSYEHIVNATHEVSFQRHMAATSAFFGWVELMMLFGRFPALGVYTLMFTRIAKSMLRFMMAFITLLIGFALSFLVLFYMDDSFSTVGHSIVKVLMMMVGEIDYSDLVDENTPAISYIILVVFLFSVSILMINLLIGVAVNDISNLEYFGKIQKLSKQASLLVSLENLVFFMRNSRIFPKRTISPFGRLLKINPTLSIPLNRAHSVGCERTKISAEIVEAALAIGESDANGNLPKSSNNGENEDIQKKIDKMLEMMETLSAQIKQG